MATQKAWVMSEWALIEDESGETQAYSVLVEEHLT